MRETNIQSIEKRVYELEKNGGGGGTSDYSQLSNKPKIEGKTLSGNMTFEDLGIASAVDLAQTDGDLQDLADKFSPIYYTDEDATLDVVLHTVITDSNLPTNEARVFIVKCDNGWFICNTQRSTDNYTGLAIQQSGTDRYTFHGSIGGSQTIVTPFAGGGGSEDYSADEKAIGTWLNGETVYRKVYNVNVVTDGSAGSVPISKIDCTRVIRTYGVISDVNQGYVPIPYYQASNLYIGFFISETLDKIEFRCPSGYAGKNVYIFVEYIK